MDKTAAVDWHALRVFYFLRHWLNSFWGEFGFIFHKLFEMWVGWSSKWNDHWVKKKLNIFLYLSTHITENVGMFFVFFFSVQNLPHILQQTKSFSRGIDS